MDHAMHTIMVEDIKLVGGFNPILVKMAIFPKDRGENKKCWKPVNLGKEW